MADSWYDYLQGSPEQRLADLEKQRAQHDAMSADPRWAMLSPRQKMMAAGDTLAPTRTSDAASDLGTAAEYVLDAGVRPRDTAIRAVQEIAAGNPMRAAGLAAAAIPSVAFPGLAAGKHGSEDDWRKHGNPAVSFALDMATDPMNYIGVGMLGRAARGASKIDDAADAIRGMRYSADLSGLPKWVADDIAAGLPRPNPESSTEAMMMARRGADVDTTPLPSEWARSEADLYGKGYRYVTRQRGFQQSVPNIYGDIPDTTGLGIADYVAVPPRGGVKRVSVRVPSDPPRPYPYDASAARQERRLANARAILESGRQNPDIMSQLPAVFRLPVSDDLILRLASEAQNPLVPLARGAAIGAGATLGGGLAYGLYPDEEVR